MSGSPLQDRMKNWEIMAVLRNSLGDKSWACPARRPGTKGRGWVGPLRVILLVRGKPGASLASPNPVTQPRRLVIGQDWNPRREGGTESLLSDWSARSGAGHVLGDVSRQFRLVSRSPPRERSLLPGSEDVEPANCCCTVLSSNGT